MSKIGKVYGEIGIKISKLQGKYTNTLIFAYKFIDNIKCKFSKIEDDFLKINSRPIMRDEKLELMLHEPECEKFTETKARNLPND